MKRVVKLIGAEGRFMVNKMRMVLYRETFSAESLFDEDKFIKETCNIHFLLTKGLVFLPYLELVASVDSRLLSHLKGKKRHKFLLSRLPKDLQEKYYKEVGIIGKV